MYTQSMWQTKPGTKCASGLFSWATKRIGKLCKILPLCQIAFAALSFKQTPSKLISTSSGNDGYDIGG